ncbi:aryl-sulfate sulfotransferase [bacterium]|nr:aryl-sulfate sulfotransferase [bacterium]
MNNFILKFLVFTGLLVLATSILGQSTFQGYALYNELGRNTTYLIDKDGNIAHSWQLQTACNYAVLLKENGNIIRGGVYPMNVIFGAAVGGMVQEIDPSGNVVWEFVYSDANRVSHHDITLMPNGGVLLTAWEVKSNAEMAALGYTGNGQKYVTHFIEVQQDSTSSNGKIVWEWHMYDHLVQNVDPAKPNYAVVKENPQLLDINVSTSGFGGGGGFGADWLHVNGVDYNEDLDQLVFSSRFLSEIFVIDHSTTVAEAASHSGGNSGMGGDIMYRWGNPSNYDTPGSQYITAAVHDTRFITDDGRPNGGYIQFFNNEGGPGNSSAVDALKTPWNGTTYDKVPNQPYAPFAYSWRHECRDNANGQSASNRLSNGNTFVALSGDYMYEVDSLGVLVWQYNAGPAKAFRYECNHPGIQALLANPCFQPGVGISDLEVRNIKLFPNPSTGVFILRDLPTSIKQLEMSVLDLTGKEVAVQIIGDQIDLSNQPVGMYFLRLVIDGEQTITKKITIQR